MIYPLKNGKHSALCRRSVSRFCFLQGFLKIGDSHDKLISDPDGTLRAVKILRQNKAAPCLLKELLVRFQMLEILWQSTMIRSDDGSDPIWLKAVFGDQFNGVSHGSRFLQERKPHMLADDVPGKSKP